MEADGSFAQESERQFWLKMSSFLLKKIIKEKIPGFQSLKIIQALTDRAIEPSFFFV